MSEICEQYLGAALTDFDDDVQQAVERFLAKWKGTLFVSGPPGSGKTRLLHAVVAEVAKMHDKWEKLPVETRNPKAARRARITRCTTLLLDLHGSFREFGPVFLDAMSREGRSEWLVCYDDLGDSKPSDWDAGVLFEIINERYEWSRPTIITSNLDLDGIAATFNDRLASRLSDTHTGMALFLGGRDRRVKEDGE